VTIQPPLAAQVAGTIRRRRRDNPAAARMGVQGYPQDLLKGPAGSTGDQLVTGQRRSGAMVVNRRREDGLSSHYMTRDYNNVLSIMASPNFLESRTGLSFLKAIGSKN
jgi:hypothetical protein